MSMARVNKASWQHRTRMGKDAEWEWIRDYIPDNEHIWYSDILPKTGIAFIKWDIICEYSDKIQAYQISSLYRHRFIMHNYEL